MSTQPGVTAFAAIKPPNPNMPTVIENLPMTPMDMIGRAVTQGAGIDVLEKLMGLQERWDAHQARKAFDEAMAGAKAKIPVVGKNKRVFFESKKEGAAKTDYWYEDLGEIARTIDPILSEHGLSYRFRPTSTPNQPVTVTCIISHRLGHCEESTLSAAPDNSGNKNSIQAIGSTITFLQRYTLKAALGLAAARDDDGRTGDGVKAAPKPPNPNTPAPTGPRLLPVNDQTPAAWADLLWGEIQKATTTEMVKAWQSANQQILDKLEEEAPEIATDLFNDIAQHLAKLARAMGPKPPNPNVQGEKEEEDGIPRNLMRSPGMLKLSLLGLIAKLNTEGDLDHIAKDRDFYDQKQKLPKPDQVEVDMAFLRRSGEIRFPKK